MTAPEAPRWTAEQVRAQVPAGWLAKQSVTLVAPDGQANVIVSSEPLDRAVTTDEYAHTQGELLRRDFPGYAESVFTVLPLSTGPAYLRLFSWSPPNGVPVVQQQVYLARGGTGYTATATAPATTAAALAEVFDQVFATLVLDVAAAPAEAEAGPEPAPLPWTPPAPPEPEPVPAAPASGGATVLAQLPSLADLRPPVPPRTTPPPAPVTPPAEAPPVDPDEADVTVARVGGAGRVPLVTTERAVAPEPAPDPVPEPEPEPVAPQAEAPPPPAERDRHLDAAVDRVLVAAVDLLAGDPGALGPHDPAPAAEAVERDVAAVRTALTALLDRTSLMARVLPWNGREDTEQLVRRRLGGWLAGVGRPESADGALEDAVWAAARAVAEVAREERGAGRARPPGLATTLATATAQLPDPAAAWDESLRTVSVARPQRYRLRLALDPSSGALLHPDDDASAARWGGEVSPYDLPVPADLADELRALLQRHLRQEAPDDELPAALPGLADRLRRALGPAYVIVG
ncbi:hypothetical protein [Blastococcus sp. SYSU D00820]